MNVYDLKKQAVRCAWLDLTGVVEAAAKDPRIEELVDIDAITLTLQELEAAFVGELEDLKNEEN